ncbi:MAG: tyrosine recombinase XerC [Ruminococcaceae bacterium]|nr:tyrosine recombinase XerC [Oscillospiraceae bacterium]
MNSEYRAACPQIFREYFGYLETITGKSSLTVDEYFLDLRTFFRYFISMKGLVSEDTPFEEIDISIVDAELCKQVTLADIYEFMNFLSADRENHAAARSRKCSALRSFFGYLTNKKNILQSNPVEQLSNPKLSSTLPKFLSLEQSFSLLEAVDGPFKERDYAILMMFLTCGMRLSELVGINYSDMLSDNRLRLRGKGDKERIVYMNDACREAVERYMKVRPVDGVIDKEALFLSKRKQRISPKTVQWLVKKYLSEIGLSENGYSVHKLRHTAATLMYQHGEVDIRALKEILGHVNLGTTQIYTHVSSESMRNAADANPIGAMRPPQDNDDSE